MTEKVLPQTKMVNHTQSIKILRNPEKRFCIGVYFIKLEVPKHIRVRNKININIQAKLVYHTIDVQ